MAGGERERRQREREGTGSQERVWVRLGSCCPCCFSDVWREGVCREGVVVLSLGRRRCRVGRGRAGLMVSLCDTL